MNRYADPKIDAAIIRVPPRDIDNTQVHVYIISHLWAAKIMVLLDIK